MPTILVFACVLNTSRSNFLAVMRCQKPAITITISKSPYFSRYFAAASSTDSSLATSIKISPPLRAERTTWQPFAVNSLATASPIPDDAPITQAFLSLQFITSQNLTAKHLNVRRGNLPQNKPSSTPTFFRTPHQNLARLLLSGFG